MLTWVNEKSWNSLKEIFDKERPAQNTLVEQIITNLRYIRKQPLADGSARGKIKMLKNFLIQSMVVEDVTNSLKECVFTNYVESKLIKK